MIEWQEIDYNNIHKIEVGTYWVCGERAVFIDGEFDGEEVFVSMAEIDVHDGEIRFYPTSPYSFGNIYDDDFIRYISLIEKPKIPTMKFFD